MSIFLIIPASFASEDIALDESPDVSIEEETMIPTLESTETVELTAEDNTIYVNAENGTDEGTGTIDNPVKTIQKGITLSGNGGTIYLIGTFMGSGNSMLTFNGEPTDITFTGLENAVIDGNSTTSFAYVSKGTYTFNNITFINNFKSGGDRVFGGVFENKAPGILNFNNCWFENNTAYGQSRGNGGAIDNEGTVTIRNSTFLENHADIVNSAGNRKNAADGGAISNLGKIYVYDTNFIRNSALRNGGAIRSQDGAKAYIENCTFDENMAAYHKTGGTYGGAVYTWDAGVDLINCSFKNNKICELDGNTALGGAVSCIRGGTVKIIGCEFINNTATGQGTTSGQSVYVEVPTTINYCAFDTSIYIPTSNINLENNWWAVDGEPNQLIENLPSGVEINKYAILNITSDSHNTKDMNITVSLTWNDGTQTDIAKIPVRTVNLISDNGNFEQDSGKLTDGIFKTRFTLTSTNNASVTATVDGVPVVLDLSDISIPLTMTVNDTEIFEGETAVITITADANTTGTCLIEINDTKITGEFDKGIATISIPDLDVGDYEFTVQFLGNELYAPTNTTAIVKVNKKEDCDIEVNSTTPTVGENATVTITLPSDAKGNITVTDANGNNYSCPVTGGTAIVEVPNLPKGDNNIIVTYTGDEKYNEKTVTSTVHVNPKNTYLNAETFEMYQGDGTKYLVSLTGTDRIPIAGKGIKVNIVGKTYTIITDENGTAALPINLKSGIYPATAVFNGDAEYGNATPVTTEVNVMTKVRINQNKDLVKDYGDSDKFTVHALDKYGKPVGANAKVKMTIAGKTYTIFTDSKGYASLPINLKPGTYEVVCEYGGYKTTNKVTVKQVLSSYNKQYKKASSYKYTATLKHSNGKVISGKTVTFTFKGKTYSQTTNSKGEATITIKEALNIGKYNIAVKYIDSTLKKTITIK